MKAILKPIRIDARFSFTAHKDEGMVCYDKWHYHPEIELVHTLVGRGTFLAGDYVGQYEEGHMVLLGANLPHVWKTDVTHHDPRFENQAISNVIQFLPTIFTDGFQHLSEMEPLKKLFEEAQIGIEILGSAKKKVAALINKIIQTSKGLGRLALLMQLLEIIAHTHEKNQLCTPGFTAAYHQFNTGNINRVIEFILTDFDKKITVDQAADIAHMSVSNFCRYFKKRTQKTFVQFLTEVRIGHTCRMLLESEKSVQQIALECGFNNLSNFNRSFRMIKGNSPLAFKNYHESRLRA